MNEYESTGLYFSDKQALFVYLVAIPTIIISAMLSWYMLAFWMCICFSIGIGMTLVGK